MKVKEQTSAHGGPLPLVALGALGVVFGDIGTSPLYTLKTVVELVGGKPTEATILGIVSLIVWTLTIITTIKYVSVAMRIDNDGEGGILALMSLVGTKEHKRPMIVAIGLFGAALIYGDGAITPAISVLSALEGLEIATPSLKPHIVPLALVILAGLFVIQPLGTAKIGRAFGPIMAIWFVTIALLGINGIVQHPSVLAALNPMYALRFLSSSGYVGFLTLGGIFLCATGAEALYGRHGPFWRSTHSSGVVRSRFSEFGFELCRPSGFDFRSRHDRSKRFLQALPRAVVAAADLAVDRCNDHREPIHHYRGVLDDASGHQARLDAADAHRADVG